MSLGLPWIHYISQIKSYDEKRNFLANHTQRPSARLFFGPMGLLDLQSWTNLRDSDKLLCEYTEQELMDKIPNFHNEEDLDPGPYEAWKHQFNKLPLHRCQKSASSEAWRRRGNAFWDKKRLDTTTFLLDPINVSEKDAKTQERLDTLDMTESWNARTRLHNDGASGYWQMGGLSRVKWEQNRQDQQ